MPLNPNAMNSLPTGELHPRKADKARPTQRKLHTQPRSKHPHRILPPTTQPREKHYPAQLYHHRSANPNVPLSPSPPLDTKVSRAAHRQARPTIRPAPAAPAHQSMREKHAPASSSVNGSTYLAGVWLLRQPSL
ncbi:hypothetical protein AMECASPLE_020723 [Ameca splendens]|uniref:Uncharacterized protein n=1 Tax=Ameca splendens TaxID=208324 RepID=A0ABV1ACX7_9TELE